jgi:opacity protein-like surface antigen
MKQLINVGLISGLALSSSVFGANPIQGWYGNLIAGVTHGPSSYSRTFTGNAPNIGPIAVTGTVNNSFVGGGVGMGVGYRIQQFRIEAQAFYSYIHSESLTIGNCTLVSPSLETPIGGAACPPNAGFNGSSSLFYGMINGFYDFYISEDSDLSPYLGLGIGGANQKNGVNFVNTTTLQSIGGNTKSNSPAAQFIVGLNYFIDDYATIGMDFRYLSTSNLKNQNSTTPNVINAFSGQTSDRYTMASLNFLINFSFDNSTS